jgi:hypothetical protein
MAYRSTAPAQRERRTRVIFFHGAVLTAVFSALLLLNACSGVSVPASASTSSSSSSSASSSSNLIISSGLPAGAVGSSYSATLSVSGGTSPYAFSMASGQLPIGVLLGGTSGTISGTPTATGNFNFAVSVSDSKGLSKQQPLQIAVASAAVTTAANSFSNIQQASRWELAGQGPPNFVDCSPSPCDGITFSMNQGIKSPSMSGNATQYNLGGTAVYTDALFDNHLIGPFSSQGLPDTNQTLVPTYHTFTYDTYFYGTNLELSQALEFDINQFFDSLGFIWGHECRIAGGHEWDIWDNVTAHWVPTGVACNPVDNSWNHVTIQVQRTSGDQLLYQSITLNGVTSTLNQTYDHGSAPGWYGITINYQMDGNSKQSPYSVYLDDLTFSYE